MVLPVNVIWCFMFIDDFDAGDIGTLYIILIT